MNEYVQKQILKSIFTAYEPYAATKAGSEAKKKGIGRFLKLKIQDNQQKEWLKLKEYTCNTGKLKEWIISKLDSDFKLINPKDLNRNIDKVLYYATDKKLFCALDNLTLKAHFYYWGESQKEKQWLESIMKVKIEIVYPVNEVTAGSNVVSFNLKERPDLLGDLKPRKTYRRKFN